MPNWCYTRYAIEAEPKEIQTFNAILDRLDARKKPLIENGFGKLWCGILVHLLGKDWKNVRCRGKITGYEILDGALYLYVESAWCELSELRALFLEKYPDAKVFYMSEEPGMEIYQTNDEYERYFTTHFVVDSEKDGMEYFDDIESSADYVQTLTGKETPPTKEGVRNVIADWVEEDPKNRWMCFHEFEVVDC